MLSRHQFAQARERATVLNHRTPDDVMTYGYIAEADIALGNYPEAEDERAVDVEYAAQQHPGTPDRG